MKKNRNLLKRVMILISIVLVLMLPIIISRFVIIKKIECESQYGTCPEEIELRIKNYELSNLTTVKKVITKTLHSNNMVEDFSMQFKLPSTLKVNLVLKKAIFALNNMLIDKDGYVLVKNENPNLPKIVWSDKNYDIGEKVGSEEYFTLNLIMGVYTMYGITVGNVDGEKLTVELPTGLNVLFPIVPDNNKDANYYLGALRLIMAKLDENSEGKYHEIDLRFFNPVLR